MPCDGEAAMPYKGSMAATNIDSLKIFIVAIPLLEITIGG
ncbi:hypothetical protein CAter10_1508 [Collimonas arenae]|nr:hypothetical protein CAter10_1508 [Collimonas arenae]